MNTIFEQLADALRDEMQEYGELLALLGEQQEAIFGRNVEKVGEIDFKLELCATAIGRCRKEREDRFAEVAKLVGASSEKTLSAMLSDFPAPLRPMFSALIGEINDLLDITRRKATQNKVLLGKTLETTREVLRALRPDAVADTYNNRGKMTVAPGGKAALKNLPTA